MENVMSLNESSATALVRFTGLGIVCFNKQSQRGEIGAIRDDKHKLTIKLQQPAYQEGTDNDVIVYQDIASYENLPKNDVYLEIEAVVNPAIEGFEIYQGEDFDRLDSSDPNDFRWIVNMHRLHGAADLAPATKQNYPLAKIYISNGLFYAHKLDRNLFFERVEKDATGTATHREIFGNVAETIGVKIEGDEVKVRIRIAEREETHLLKRVAGIPYRIEIRNVDPNAAAVYSDMPDYYQYLSSQSGRQVDLSPLREDENGETESTKAISQKDFCHPIVVENPVSIDSL
jgi:hypothetical protein